jgi:hypothetical protein
MSVSSWIPTAEILPDSNVDVLVWSGGRCVVAVLLTGRDERGAWRDFMDPVTDGLLEWPTHWAPLPPPPQ